MPSAIGSGTYPDHDTTDPATLIKHDTRALTPALHHLTAFGPPRERTITWHDPTTTIELGRRLSGRDYLAAMRDGRLPEPPIMRLAGVEAIRIEHGDTLYRCIADQSFLNPIGVIHGGLICTLLDYAAASALLAILAAGAGFTTIELKVSYLRPVRAGDTLLAHGWITKPGKRIAFAEADLRNGEDQLVATASSSLLVIATPTTRQPDGGDGTTAPEGRENNDI